MGKVVKAIGSLLGVKKKKTNHTITDSTTKLVGIPLSVIYGRARVTGNVVWRQDSADKKTRKEVVALCWGPVTIHTDTVLVNDKRPEYINGVLNPKRNEEPGYLTGVKIWTTGTSGTSGQSALFNLEQGFNRTAYIYIEVTANDAVSDINGIEAEVSRGNLFVSGDYQTPIPSGIADIRSSNPIAAALDYLLNIEYGSGKAVEEFGDFATWIDAINQADGMVTTQQSGLDIPVWTGLVNAIPTDGGVTLTKAGGTGAAYDAYGRTSEMITAAGSLRFKFNDIDHEVSVGLSTYYVLPNYTSDDLGVSDGYLPGSAEFTTNPMGVNHSIVSNGDGTVSAVEGGVVVHTFTGTPTESDIFEIAVTGGAVLYKKNGTTAYTSAVAPAFPLAGNAFFKTELSSIDIVTWSRSDATDEYRYSVGMEVGADGGETPLDNVQALLDIANAECYDSNGIIKCWTAKAGVSVANLTRSNFTPTKVETADMTTIPNVIVLTYAQVEDGEQRDVTWTNPTLLGEWGEKLEKVDYHGIPYREQASRKVALMGRRQYSERLTVHGYADHSMFTLEPGDIVNVTIGDNDLNWFDAKKFWVQEVTPENRDGNVDLVLKEYGGDALYDDTASDVFDSNDPLFSRNQTPIHNDPLAKPRNGSAFAYEILQIDNNPAHTFYVRLTWANADQPAYLQDAVVIYRRAEGGDSGDWQPVGTVDGNSLTYEDWSVQPDAAGYEYAIITRSSYGVLADFPATYHLAVEQLSGIARGSSPVVSVILNTERPGQTRADLRLTWTAASQTDPAIKHYDVRYIRDKDHSTGSVVSQQQSVGETTDTTIVLEDVTRGTYDFYIYTVATDERRSTARTVQFVVDDSAFHRLPEITGLELFGRGNSNVFTGKHARFIWRVNNPLGAGELGEERFGADTGSLDTFFFDYQVKIIDIINGTVVRTESVRDPSYTYTLEKNAEDFGTPRRNFKIEVRYRDQWNRVSEASNMVVTNTAPGVPSGLTITPNLGSFVVKYDPPADLDFAGTIVLMRNAPGVTADPQYVVYNGPDTATFIQADPNATWYVKVASYDQFGTTDLNYSSEVTVAPLYKVDTVAPSIPTGLSGSTEVIINADGAQTAWINIDWDNNSESDLAGYDWAIKENSGGYVFGTTGESRFRFSAVSNYTYTIKVRAFDTSGNKSAYTAEYTIVAAKDNIAPGAPSGLTATAAIRNVFLQYTAPGDADISHFEIWESASNNRGSGAKIADHSGTTYVRSGLPSSTLRYYWVRAVDTSGNIGDFNAGNTSGVPVTTAQIATPDIVAGAIITDHMAAGTIDANRLKAGTVLTAGVNISNAHGTGGVPISTIQAYSVDPITRANANTTQLLPGLVQINGGTTLQDWRYGPDQTKIAGGFIGANSISANKLEIGLRGITMNGMQFEAQRHPSTGAFTQFLMWSSGSISYINDAGTPVTQLISAGACAATPGTTMYIVWVKGNSNLGFTENLAAASADNAIILASYRGNADLVVTYGRTIIDGSNITTGSITAAQFIKTEALITNSAQIGTAVINSAHISNLSADLITVGTMHATRIVAGSIETDRLGTGAVSAVYSGDDYGDIGINDTGSWTPIIEVNGVDIIDGNHNVLINLSGVGRVNLDQGGFSLKLEANAGGGWYDVRMWPQAYGISSVDSSFIPIGMNYTYRPPWAGNWSFRWSGLSIFGPSKPSSMSSPHIHAIVHKR